MEETSDYEPQKAVAQEIYARTKPVHSPAIGELVTFTAEGFNHVLFKGRRSERERSSQIMRFKLLPWAIRLIKHANTFQEFEETNREYEVKVRKRRRLKTKLVRYWGIIAIFQERKIKVILRKIGNGQLHFWSIVPAWTTNKHRDVIFGSTMKGDPETD
ncbi:MAG: hypothetical protein K2Y04_11640 [Caulobacteraceae bacterium]|nr:hypothetical protein [Caulobacteraceae bacterium]